MQTKLAERVKAFRPVAALLPTGWHSGFATAADGAPLHYTRTGGSGPAVLLLHGLQASGLMWLRTAQALEARYDVVMPDFRGHGQSARSGAAFSAPALVADTAALIGKLQLDTPFVVGHSMGADIAGRLAAEHPVRAAVLVEPALRNFAVALAGAGDPPPWLQHLLNTLAALKGQTHAERMMSGLRLLPPGASVEDEADYVTLIEGAAEFDGEIYRKPLDMGYLIADPATLARIAAPVLLMTAAPQMPGADADAAIGVFEQNIRRIEHVRFPDSGHFIMAERFERFVATLEHFLQAH